MRYAIIALSLLFGAATPAAAGVGVGISISGVSIGIHVPAYPELVPVPGYPVYYAPQLRANYFFYDGYYWLYHDDRWYVSDWYDGPWDIVEPDDVPLFVLRVPVRYYLAPPLFFHGWYLDAPPHWHVHWGHRWTRHYHGWERWNHHVAYAPLPHYQRHYAGHHYPHGEHRRLIRREHYQHRPHDPVVRRHHQPRQVQHARPAQRMREPAQRQLQQPVAPRYSGPVVQPPPRPQVQRTQPAPRQRELLQRPLRTEAVVPPRSTHQGFRQTERRPQVRERSPAASSGARESRGHRERQAGAAIQARAQERGQRHPAQDRSGRRN